MARAGLRLWPFFLVLVALAAGAAGYLAWCQKAPAPAAQFADLPKVLGRSTVLALDLRAARGGLVGMEVRVVQGDKDAAVLSRSFEGAPSEQRVEVRVEPAALGLRDGEAQLKVLAWDNAWRPMAVDRLVLAAPVAVDLTPPTLEVLSYTRYLDQGGSGVAVLRAAGAAWTGVSFNGREQPAFAVEGAPAGVVVALFALPWSQNAPFTLAAAARDEAGNVATRAIPAEIRPKRFPTDTIELKAEFMARAVSELLPQRSASTPDELLAAFLVVNRDQRREAVEALARLGRTTQPRVLWKGAFLQPPNTQVFANFAETRHYRWGGQEVDRQTHLGYDLASLQRAPVPAANAGTVVFTGSLTIYGNTVILDHGLGLHTLYGHLSAIDVRQGDAVAKGQVLGRSGTTGLAVGDHLHYEVLLHGQAVSPVEWWDGKWIRDRIAGPLADAGLGQLAEGS